MDAFWSDVRFGWRTLWKSPGFTAAAILTLALGIGANTAVFSVVNGVLLNPLPFPDAKQLVVFYAKKPNFAQGSLSYLNYLDIKHQNRAFSAMGAYRSTGYVWTGKGQAEVLRAEMISAGLFEILGVKAEAGRTFAEREDRPSAQAVVVISDRLWRRRFGADPRAVGKTMTLDGRDYLVIGVAPSDFRMNIQNFSDEHDLYVLLGQMDSPRFLDRSAAWGLDGIARLKMGLMIEQGRADLEQVAANLARAYPEANKGVGATVAGIREATVGAIQPFLLLLAGAVAFVLLIACANVANLLLARANGRMREFAIRGALGASGRRLIRQLLTESVLLGAAGGGAALLLASWVTGAVVRRFPEAVWQGQKIGINGRVLFYTAAVSLATGILFGLAPALRVRRADVSETLKEGGRGGSGRRLRSQEAFVMAEMAIALMLLAGAGLMIRSLERLQRVDPGFDAHNLLTANAVLSPGARDPEPAAMRAKLRDLVHETEELPQVKAVSLEAGSMPMEWDDEQLFWKSGEPKPATEHGMRWALLYLVTPDHLKTMGIPLKSGRFFSEHDDEGAETVAVIDDEFRKKHFPNEDPLGKVLNLENASGNRTVLIVGVVGHVKQWGLERDEANPLRAELYLAMLQAPDKEINDYAQDFRLMTRTVGEPVAVVGALRRTLHTVSRDGVLNDARPMEELIADTFGARRISMILLGGFAGLALALAGVGLYGVVAYVVGQRTPEIGIRIALGASTGDVFREVLGDGLKMAGGGALIGVAGSVAVNRLMTDMLFGVSPADPLTFATVGSGLLLVAALACYVPARRAMRVDPTVALRYE